MPEFFKGDDLENKYFNVGSNLFDQIETEKTSFFNDCYENKLLGEIIHKSKIAPLSNAIPLDVFKDSFNAIFNIFLEAGSFEGYLTVFKAIFGPDVDVTFTVPAPGKLGIVIEAQGLLTFNLAARKIVSDAYVFEPLVDHNDNNIVVNFIRGLSSQSEVEIMLNELVPQGVWTDIDLTIGGGV